jgi:hypothetical protein
MQKKITNNKKVKVLKAKALKKNPIIEESDDKAVQYERDFGRANLLKLAITATCYALVDNGILTEEELCKSFIKHEAIYRKAIQGKE